MFNPYQYVQKEPYMLYIDGEYVPSESGETFDILNPANNQVFAQAYQGGKADVEKAIRAARRAFDHGPWKDMTHFQRSELLYRARDLMEKRAKEFACLETLDCGKIFPGVMHHEVPRSLDAFRYSAGHARHLEGKVVPVDGGGNYFNYVTWEPCGVVGEILPWNGPLTMGCQKISAILAAGNTIVVKPAEWASLSLLALASIFEEAGFPKGVFNIVTGPGSEVGAALVESPEVDMVSLTGGTDTGKDIIRRSAETLKQIALELGGKSPNIIFDDVDLDVAARWAVAGFTMNSGQVCVAGTRILVQETIYEAFLEEMKKVCEKLVPGDGFAHEQGVNFPTLISREHAEGVWSYIRKGTEEGARLVLGGEPYQQEHLQKGNFVPPTIFADVKPQMTTYQEEIFGPVACVTPFKDESEAVELANNVRYGLAGAVFTKNGARAHRVASQIKAGQIYINSYFSKGIMESPGTGWKQSGLGVAGIHKYMHSRTVFMSFDDRPEAPI